MPDNTQYHAFHFVAFTCWTALLVKIKKVKFGAPKKEDFFGKH